MKESKEFDRVIPVTFSLVTPSRVAPDMYGGNYIESCMKITTENNIKIKIGNEISVCKSSSSHLIGLMKVDKISKDEEGLLEITLS